MHIHNDDGSPINPNPRVNVSVSTRQKSRPTWMNDFHVPGISKDSDDVVAAHVTKYPLANYVSYEAYPASHKHFIANIVACKEPLHYSQAVKDPRQIEVMNQELKALEDNTWVVQALPSGKKTIGVHGCIKSNIMLMDPLRESKQDK